MTAISIKDLAISFGDKDILKNITFSLEENDKLGIIGINGCGKSTLFRLILGEYEPTNGEIIIAKNKTIGILTQDCALEVSDLMGDSAIEQMYTAFPELIRAERRLNEIEIKLQNSKDDFEKNYLSNEYSELYRKFTLSGGLEYKSKCLSTLIKMGLSEEETKLKLRLLSGGQRTRLAIAKELAREPDILLLDEPTNHLDKDTVTVLENYIKSYKKCVMIISHDRYFLDSVTNKTLAIEYGEAKLYNGSYTATIKQRETDNEIALHHYENQQKEIKRQEAYIAQQRAWNRERNIVAAESRQKMLDKMVKLEKPREAPKAIKMKFQKSVESGNEVLRATNLSKKFDNQILFENVNFLILKKERVFLIGKNGSGKSTFMKILTGKTEATSGYLEAGYNVDIGYFDQEERGFVEGNTVLDELWNAYPEKKECDIRNNLARFRFNYDDTEKDISMLSGGESARLSLCKLIMSPMNFLVLDEPTNHLDIMSREALEDSLNEFDGTIFIVSHDRYLINKLATRIIEIDRGNSSGKDFIDYKVTNIGRGYDEYEEFKKNRYTSAAVETKQDENISKSKEDYLARKKQASDKRKEEAKIERLKKEQLEIENRLSEIEKEMYSDEVATDYKKASELDEEKNKLEERLLEIYEELEI